jgi:hypothetical protein
MPTLANQLVQFLMSLFNNPAAVQEFLNNPEHALEGAGLREVSSADVDAAMPVVLDYAPITVNASSFDRDYNTGRNTSWTGGNGGAGHTPPPAGGGAGNTAPLAGNTYHDDHAHAIQQLTHVVNNYSYTSTVDDRDTITDQSVNQNIWADGDVTQWFENEAVIASGDHALAAGDDLNVRDSYNTRDSHNTDNSIDNSTDNSLHAGGNVNVGNSQVDVDDAFNTDVDLDVADSFNDNSDNSVDISDNSDNSVDNSVQISDAFQDNSDNSSVDSSTHTDVAIEDSFQDNSTVDNSTNTDVAVDTDVGVDDSTIVP